LNTPVSVIEHTYFFTALVVEHTEFFATTECLIASGQFDEFAIPIRHAPNHTNRACFISPALQLVIITFTCSFVL
jgi:hypothetical protein